VSDIQYGLDTSVAVPLLMNTHGAHEQVAHWAQGRKLGLCGHALAETYSVLTRLPGANRLDSTDAAMLINDSFTMCWMIPTELAHRVHDELSQLGISGGVTYDGLVALAARENNIVLVTRDARALSTYEACGVRLEVLTKTVLPRNPT